MTEINTHSFDDHLAAVLRKGTLLTAWTTVATAVGDPRFQRRHFKVLVELLRFLNSETGTAWPSRSTIAQRCGLNVRTVQNVLYDLRKWEYLAWERRSVGLGKSLLNYTVALMSSNTVVGPQPIPVHGRDAGVQCTAGGAIASNPPAIDVRVTVQKTAPPIVQQKLTKESIERAGRHLTHPRQECRLPSDWILPDEWLAWAIEAFVVTADEVHREAAVFRDYWLGQPDSNGFRKDWSAVWRRWCGNNYSKWRPRTTNFARASEDANPHLADPWAEVRERRGMEDAIDG